MALKDLHMLYPFRRCDMFLPPVTGQEFREAAHLKECLDAMKVCVLSATCRNSGGRGPKTIVVGYHQEVRCFDDGHHHKEKGNAEASGAGNCTAFSQRVGFSP